MAGYVPLHVLACYPSSIAQGSAETLHTMYTRKWRGRFTLQLQVMFPPRSLGGGQNNLGAAQETVIGQDLRDSA